MVANGTERRKGAVVITATIRARSLNRTHVVACPRLPMFRIRLDDFRIDDGLSSPPESMAGRRFRRFF